MEYLIDFQSEFVEANTSHEAYKKAIALIEEKEIKIDKIQVWDNKEPKRRK